MKWYYADGGQSIGPAGKEEILELAESNVIKPETLVWHSGMSDWEPFGQVMKKKDDIRSEVGQPEGPTGGSICSECARRFHQDDMIRYGDAWVCAACKPAFVQKLKEGVMPAGELQYAGFWIRFLARFVDGFVIMGATLIMVAPLGILFSDLYAEVMPYFQPLSILVAIVYETWFLGKFGATLGKMACKIKVVTPDGGKITYLRGFGRYFATFLSSIIFCIGYIIAGFDSQKRALHDHICGTRVVRK